MPRPKKFPSDSVKTTAQIPLGLHKVVSQQVKEVSLNFTLAEAVNEGLFLWMALKTGDRHTKKQLEELLEVWRGKLVEPESAAKKTAAKVTRSGTQG